MSKDNEIFQSGELELKKAFEETTTRNVKMILDHSNETRRLVLILEQKILTIEQSIQIQNEKLEFIKKLLADLQGIIYKGGT